MREVVVHVPTLELAKKVVKIAKEQGFGTPTLELEYYLKYHKEKLCFKFRENYFSFASKRFYEEEGYKVITAEEFLSRYEPKFKPIAMKCSKEQFEAVRPKLEELGRIGTLFEAFDRYDYLTNNYNREEVNVFDFIEASGDWKHTHQNNIHHEWDEPVFLQHCGYVDKEPTELEQLIKENAELKEQLKVIEDQPKVGDVCLFWDFDSPNYAALKIYESNPLIKYDNCLKATPENIKKIINEIKLNNR